MVGNVEYSVYSCDGRFSTLLMTYYSIITGDINALNMVFEALRASFILVALLTSIYVVKFSSFGVSSLKLENLSFEELKNRGEETLTVKMLRIMPRHVESTRNSEALAYEIGKMYASRIVRTKISPTTSLWDLASIVSREVGIRNSVYIGEGLRVVRFLLNPKLRDEGSLSTIVQYFKGLWEGVHG